MSRIKGPGKIIDLLAYRNLAMLRIKRQPFRLLVFLVAAGLSASFVPLYWGGLCLAVLAIAELTERVCAQRFLSASDEAGFQGSGASKFLLAASHVGTAAAVSLGLATIWIFAEGVQRDVALYLMAVIVMSVAIANNQVLYLLMARQSLLVGTGVAMTFYCVTVGDRLDIAEAVTPLIAVILFAVLALVMSYRSGIASRQALVRESELANARDAAERADEGKSAFLATVSHELRTPLNGMLGMTQTLMLTDLKPEQLSQVKVISESGRALNALLTDILDFSKLEAGKLSIQPAEDDLRRTIDELTRLYGPVAMNKGLALTASVAPTVPARLIFDAVRVRQCLSNLISNAVKFTEVGRIDLQISAEPTTAGPDGTPRSMIRISISDTGIGIAADRQRHLFQPFSQADTSIARRYGGTGLGLSITRQLAESMGGSVSLRSAPGEGTEIRFNFVAGNPRTATDGARAGAKEDLSGRKVLVVDDVDTNRMVMRLFLQPLGVEVVEAADAPAALEVLGRERFDAAFIDLNLSGTGGAEIARKVRQGSGTHRDMPLVAVTADSAAPDIAFGPEGFDSLIHKPVDHRQLQSTLIAALLARSERHGG